MPMETSHLFSDPESSAPEEDTTVYDQPERKWLHPYWLLVRRLGIFLGCVGKSAQFPLQVWLPDAMEGPTPVSALIHAATMVAAGVYLVGRCYPLFTPEVLLTIAYVGGITLFVAATIAVVMTDIKKVLAYSTVSQLGYMFLGVGVGLGAALSSGDPRVLQGAALPRLRQRHLWLPSPARHAQDGRPVSEDEDHGPLDVDGRPRHRWHAVLLRLVLEGRNPRCGLRLHDDAQAAFPVVFVAAGHGGHHHVLHVPHVVHDVLRQAERSPRLRARTRIAVDDDDALDPACDPQRLRRLGHSCARRHPAAASRGQLARPAVASLQSAELRRDGHRQAHGPQPVHVDFIPETKAAPRALARRAVGALRRRHRPGALSSTTTACSIRRTPRQFPGVHRFLLHKWYFDEVYSALLVRPSLATRTGAAT